MTELNRQYLIKDEKEFTRCWWCRSLQVGNNRHGCPKWILLDEELIVVVIPPPAFSFSLEQNFETDISIPGTNLYKIKLLNTI